MCLISCWVTVLQGPHQSSEEKPYFWRQMWWEKFSQVLINHFSIESKQTASLLSTFWEHILWIEEFSAADQCRFLNTHFRKPYRTKFDFDLPTLTLEVYYLTQGTKLTEDTALCMFSPHHIQFERLHFAYNCVQMWAQGGNTSLTKVSRLPQHVLHTGNTILDNACFQDSYSFH